MSKVEAIPEYLQESQRSENWYKQRIGKFTGSGMKNLMAGGRGSLVWGDTAKAYVFEKLYERVSGSRIVVPETYAMSKGKEAEEGAVTAFGERTRFHIVSSEFIVYEDVDCIGASPDGLVYDSKDRLVGVFETKCRNDQSMLLNAFSEVTPKHTSYWQLQTEMLVAGVNTAYFTHYSPERKCPFDLQIQVVKADKDAQSAIIERAKFADGIIKEAIAEVGDVLDRRISYITLTERMMAMRKYIYENLK